MGHAPEPTNPADTVTARPQGRRSRSRSHGAAAGATPDSPGVDSRRERILAAAINAFASGGFHGVSTREIAQAAQVTDTLLFYHFRSKADLYLAAVEDQLDKLHDGLIQALAQSETVDQRLCAFVEVYLRYFLDLEPGLAVTLRELSGLPEATAAKISAKHHGVVTAQLEQILQDGMSSGAFRALSLPSTTFAILGMLQGYIRLAFRNRDLIPRDEMITQVLDVYAVGLRTHR